MALGVKVPGDKIKNKKIEFEAFIGPYGQNQLYHTPLLFKILDLTENKKIVNDPFNSQEGTFSTWGESSTDLFSCVFC